MTGADGSGTEDRSAVARRGRRGRPAAVRRGVASVFLLVPLAAAAGADALDAPAPGPRAAEALSPERVSGPGPSHAYLDGPPAGHTGGFGEPTCRACHFGAPLNEPPGELSIEGVPAGLPPADSAVEVTVRLVRPGLGRGGFQLSARHAAGPAAGEQAGRFEVVDRRTTADSADGVVYVGHGEKGTAAGRADSLTWTVRWLPPSGSRGPVVFHVAANAADDDASEFGDHVYADSVLVAPPPGSTPR